MRHIELGRRGESIASSYLESLDYVVVARNYRTGRGEIDIIAQKEDVLVFIEVKTRRGIRYGTPCEAVTKEKQRRIISTAKLFLAGIAENSFTLRFDVIEVLFNRNDYEVTHLINAF